MLARYRYPQADAVPPLAALALVSRHSVAFAIAYSCEKFEN